MSPNKRMQRDLMRDVGLRESAMRMVSKEVLDGLRVRVCAIGVLRVPVDEFVKDPTMPLFRVFGTGFLVSELTAITNRHVVSSVNAYIEKESLPKDRRYVAFLRPKGPGIAQTFHEVEKTGMVTTPKFLDLGLVTFRTTQMIISGHYLLDAPTAPFQLAWQTQSEHAVAAVLHGAQHRQSASLRGHARPKATKTVRWAIGNTAESMKQANKNQQHRALPRPRRLSHSITAMGGSDKKLFLHARWATRERTWLTI